MAFPDEHDGYLEGTKEYGLYWGKVVKNVDPEKLGRVTVNVPGIFTETGWAWPLGVPGGGLTSGYIAPRVGSTVAVGFVQGDTDEPYYLTGPPALGQQPAKTKEQSAADAANTRVFETETFEIFISDTPNEKKLSLRAKNGEDLVEIDAIDGSVSINATRFLILNAPLVDITGAKVQIANRPVMPIGPAI